MVRSIKKVNNITAAGLEKYPALAKSWQNHVTESNAASNFPVLSWPPRSTFPEGIYWMLGVSLSLCGCLGETSRFEMLSDAHCEDFHLGLGILRCSSSSTCPYYGTCWISCPWNPDLARDGASAASSKGSKGKCNPGAAVDTFWV